MDLEFLSHLGTFEYVTFEYVGYIPPRIGNQVGLLAWRSALPALYGCR